MDNLIASQDSNPHQWLFIPLVWCGIILSVRCQKWNGQLDCKLILGPFKRYRPFPDWQLLRGQEIVPFPAKKNLSWSFLCASGFTSGPWRFLVTLWRVAASIDSLCDCNRCGACVRFHYDEILISDTKINLDQLSSVRHPQLVFWSRW